MPGFFFIFWRWKSASLNPEYYHISHTCCFNFLYRCFSKNNTLLFLFLFYIKKADYNWAKKRTDTRRWNYNRRDRCSTDQCWFFLWCGSRLFFFWKVPTKIFPFFIFRLVYPLSSSQLLLSSFTFTVRLIRKEDGFSRYRIIGMYYPILFSFHSPSLYPEILCKISNSPAK